MDNKHISSLSDFERRERSPEVGFEPPSPETPETRPPSGRDSDTDSPKTPIPETDHPPTEPQNIVDKTDEKTGTKEVVSGDVKTVFADETEKEFITQITSELPDAKP